MIERVWFTVPGRVRAKQRARVVLRGGKARAYTPDQTMRAEEAVKWAYLDALKGRRRNPHEGPVTLSFFAYFAIPKSWPKWKRELGESDQIRPTGRPDLDNIQKLICDGLNSIAWRDDAQLVQVTAEKLYGEPCLEVEIKFLNEARRE